MITIQFNDSTEKNFKLKNAIREQSFFELWYWFNMLKDTTKMLKVMTDTQKNF